MASMSIVVIVENHGRLSDFCGMEFTLLSLATLGPLPLVLILLFRLYLPLLWYMLTSLIHTPLDYLLIHS